MLLVAVTVICLANAGQVASLPRDQVTGVRITIEEDHLEEILNLTDKTDKLLDCELLEYNTTTITYISFKGNF